MAYKIYSVESRKGGVGKTTIAMNLGKQLLKSGPVLLLDCDITGTSISDPASNSVYWKEEANVLRYEDGTPYNLLGYFLDKYVKGSGVIEDFTKEGMLQEKKINVIGSQLYTPSARLIADTRVLMDEIHSYWLMEFVCQLISAFEKNFQGKEVQIIIDNSPGFVGFCQALHNMMLKIGPSRAKYLMVSSIDEQDLKSSIYACMEISSIIKDRIKVAQYYKAQMDNRETGAESAGLIASDAEMKRFYFSLMEDGELLNSYTSKQYSEKDYLAIILNKVPKSFEDDNFEYTFENVLSPKEFEVFKEITSAKDGKPQTIVHYDEAISYQYYWKYLKNTKEEADKDPYWNRRFKTLSTQNDDVSKIADRVVAIEKQDDVYEGLLSSLSKRGYSRVVKSLPATWTPSYTYELLIDLIVRLSRRTQAYRMISPEQVDAEKLNEWGRRNLEQMKQSEFHAFGSNELNQLYQHLMDVAKDSSDQYGQRTLIMIVMFLYVTLMLLEHEGNTDQSLRSRLVQVMRGSHMVYHWEEYVNPGLINDMQIEYSYESAHRLFNLYFDRFYLFFCKTLLRMIDMHEDFNILLSAMKLYIPTASPLMFNRELISYLTSVMVSKKEDIDYDKLKKYREDSFIMKRVLDVLRDGVIKNWR